MKKEFLKRNIGKLSMIPLRGNGKEPLIRDWQKYCAEMSIFTVEELSAANYGIVTGMASGLLVLDIDNSLVFASFMRRNGYDLPDTFTVKTGKGFHKYYQYPSDGNKYGSKPFGTYGFDVRGVGGYVVGPYSVHEETGNTYEIIQDVAIAGAPKWLIDYVLKVTGNQKIDVTKRMKNQDIVKLVEEGAPKGERSEEIFSVLLSLVANGFNDDQIFYVFNRYPIGEKYIEKPVGSRDAWLQGQIDRARDLVNVESNEKDIDSGDIPEITLIDGEELLEKNCEVEWLVDGRIEKGGHLLITGKSGKGKSMLAMNMALILASGSKSEFLGNVVRPCRVAILQCENSESFMKKRLERICLLNPDFRDGLKNIKFVYLDGRHDSPKLKLSNGNLKGIIGRLYEEWQPDVIILDPYKSYSGVRENDNDENREVLDNYFYILGEYGITSIIVHHEGKTIGYEGTDKGRGASTTTDVMSNHWSVRREKDKTSPCEYLVIGCAKSRNYQKFDDINLDIVDGVYFRKTDSLHDPVKLVQMLYEVGGQLETQGEFVKLIMKTLNVSKGKSQAIIKEAVSKQLVVVDKYGQNKSRYRLPAYDKAA